MPTIIATVGSAVANSFVTVAECDAYCDGRSNADAWNNESDDDKKARALIDATRELSNKNWLGAGRVDATQALAWPRALALNPDLAWTGYAYYGTTEIPKRVKDATCELALQWLIMGTTDLGALDPTLSIKRKRVDVLEKEYFDPGMRAIGLERFPSVMRYVRPLLAGSGISVPLVRS
jgi:DnaT-like ssDNA binding protein